VTDLNFNLSFNQEFIRTSEFFALNQPELTPKALPQPHVTLRKKEWQTINE
jgi:hypothetical protein